MGERTGIAWTDSTWNPWRGCRKVSAGCAHCYMYRDQERYGRDPKQVVSAAPATFNAPLKWKKPRRVFTCSWSDFFIEEADAWRGDAWDVIRRTPHLTYQILTKRPERVAANLPDFWPEIVPHVWLGVSVESQEHAGRYAQLEQTFEYGKWDGCAAHVLFVSAEPLLGPLTFDIPEIHGMTEWVIAGGESGPAARPAKPEWLRSLRDECKQWCIPFFLKQLGGWPDPRAHEKAVLDGQTHTEMPT